MAKSNINGAKIPPGQLINLLQKGLMYTELERSVADDGSVVGSSEPFGQQRAGKADGPPAKKQKGEGGSADAGSSDGVVGENEVTVLSGHTSEVFICSWNPRTQQLASGSGDSTARVWTLPDGACGKAQANRMKEPAVLQHFSSEKEKSKDVTTLDWNADGTLLATGSYDG